LIAFWLDITAFLKAAIIVATWGGLAILIARPARSSEPKNQEIKVRVGNVAFDKLRTGFRDARHCGLPQDDDKFSLRNGLCKSVSYASMA
jgi:hypothetical protein